MKKMHRVRVWLVVALTVALSVLASGQAAPSSLEQQFRNPPDSAKPRAWWHWMSGNVTEPGITADLEWMHRVGIGGMQMFDGDMGAPLFVDKPVIWMSPEWKSAWHHAASEADRLHLEMSMAASGGWSETAGPWVKPEQGMKKYAWSETIVEGPGRFRGSLRKPPATVGKFQDLAPAPPREQHPDLTLTGAHAQPPLPKREPTPELYEDAAVVAFPAPAEEDAAQKPEITCSCGEIDGAALTDGSFGKVVEVAYPERDHAWVQFAYGEPHAGAIDFIRGGSGFALQRPGYSRGAHRSQRRWADLASAGATAGTGGHRVGQPCGSDFFDSAGEGALLPADVHAAAAQSVAAAAGGNAVASASAVDGG